MNKSFKNVPNILTNKDLLYIKDIFGWNYNNYKFLDDSLQFIDNKEIINICTECSNFFYNNMNVILSILEKGDKNEN